MNSFRTRDDTLGGAGGVRRPAGRRAPARLHAEPRAQAACRRPHAGELAGRPVAGVVPARPRRPLHRARRLRPARAAARTRATATRFVSNADNLARHRRPPGRRLVRSSGAPFATEVTPAYRRPTARAATSRSGAATASWCCARRPRRSPEDAEALSRHQPAPLLQHQQPVARPRRARREAGRDRRRARAAADPQREDRRPERQVVAEGHPDRVGDGRRRRGVRRGARARGRPLAVPAGEVDQRPARPALRRLRA